MPMSDRTLSAAGLQVGWQPAVLDIDMANLTDATKARFRDAYFEHHLVIIRSGIVSFETQAELASSIAPVLPEPDSMTYVSNARSDGLLGNTELVFHNDVFFGPDPYHGGSLHAVDVVAGNSSTRFANTVRAYNSLPDHLKERLAGLEARHVSGERNLAGRTHLAGLPEGWPHVTRPVIWEHPITKVKMLAVNFGQTDCILGLPPAASEALLEELFGYLYEPDNIFEHHWTNGDLVYWDNLALQHARGRIRENEARTLQRVSFGGKPFKEQCPTRAEAFDVLNVMTLESSRAMSDK
jgi:taurine dioxygenase